MGFISSFMKWFYGDLEDEDQSSEQEPILFATPHNSPRNGGPLSQQLLISSSSSDSCSDKSPDGVLLRHTCLDLYRNSISTDASHDQKDLEFQKCLDYLSNLSTASTDIWHDQNDHHSDSSPSDLLQQQAVITSVSFLSHKDSTLHCNIQQDLAVAGLRCFPDSATLVNNREFVEGKKQDRCPLDEQHSEVPIEKIQGTCLPEELHLKELIAKKKNVFLKKQDVCLVNDGEFVEGKKHDRCPLDEQHSEVPIEKKQGACLPEELHLKELIAKKQNVSVRKKRRRKKKQDVCLVNNREFVEAKKQDRCPVDEQHSKVPIEKKQGACLPEKLHLEKLIAKKQNVLVRKKKKEKKKQDVCLVNNREFVEVKKQDRCPVDGQHSKVPIEKKQGACLPEKLHLEKLIAKKQNVLVRKKRKEKKKQDVRLVNNREFVEGKKQDRCPLYEQHSKMPIEKKQGTCLPEELHLEELIAKKQNVFARRKRKNKAKQVVFLVKNRKFVEAKKQDRCPVDEQHSEVPIEKKQGACLPKELHLEKLIAKKQNVLVRKKRKEKKKQDVCLVNNREFVEGKKQDRCPLFEQHSKMPIEKKQGACLPEELHLEELIAKKQNAFGRKKRKKKTKQDECLVNNRKFVEAKKQDRCPLDEQHSEGPIEKKQGALHLKELIAQKQNEFVRKKSKKKKKQDVCLVNNREFVEGKKQDRCLLDEQHSEVPFEKKQGACLPEKLHLEEPIAKKQNVSVRKKRRRKKKQDVCLLEELHFKEPVANKRNVRLLGEIYFEAPIAMKQDVCLLEELHFEEPIEKKQGVCLQGDLHSEEPIEEEVIKGVVAEERWIKHYSSFQKILLVGEGDFSFSASLANAFGSANNMIATSLDSRDAVIRKYKNAKSNLEILEQLGACVLHGVDATKMKLHTDLRMRKFDRIIFNFPHAGFHGKEGDPRLIMKHRNLVHGFFKNSCSMLIADGEVHVNHKTTPPFCTWNLGELAGKNSLLLTECVDFKIQDYPGYRNKRGDGLRCDEPFRLGESSTFKFRYSGAIK